MINVFELMIRRDLLILEECGFLKCVYGGVFKFFNSR